MNLPPQYTESDWRLFVRLFAISVGITISGLVGLNLIVNPAGYYPGQLLPRLTANDMIEKQLLLKSALPRPEALILGSSTSMKLSPSILQQLTRRPSFNAGTSAAVPLDTLEMLRYAVEDLGLSPKLVVLGLDVEMFDNGDRPTAHLPSVQSRLSALLSPEQTTQSVRSLRMWVGNSFPLPLRRFDPDGYLHVLLLEQEARQGINSFDNGFDAFLSDYKKLSGNFTTISSAGVKDFSRLLRYCKAHNIEVVVFFTPMHPRLQQELEANNLPKLKRDFRMTLNHVCDEAKVLCHDLIDVQDFGGDPADFSDGVHVGERNAELILRRIVPSQHAVQ